MDELKLLAATYLLEFKEHLAGNGSKYISIGEFTIRISDHENISKAYSYPDLNVVKRKLTQEDVQIVKSNLNYPNFIQQKIFSMYSGITIPKLKKILGESYYEEVVLDEIYTKTTLIKTSMAISKLKELGFTDYNLVLKETSTFEDFNGHQ
jgi:hypothetical protein